MPRRFRRQPDGVDSDQIGRMGARRPRDRSVNSELARRLRGFKGRTRKYLSGGSAGRGMRQRVVVKAHVSRHKPGKARGSLARVMCPTWGVKAPARRRQAWRVL